MVLSNKKLKQKLRAAKAELIAAAVTQNNLNSQGFEKYESGDSKSPHSLLTLLNPTPSKGKVSKREKRRERAGQNMEVVKHNQVVGGAEDKSETDDVDLKKKKRKRDQSDASEEIEKKPEQPKKKKKSKKKKKPKAKARSNQVEDEMHKQDGSEATGEQLVAKACGSTDSNKELELSTRVYVGGIPYYSTEDDIRSYFDGCGTITSVDCMTFPDTRKFRGIAMITFKTEAAAKRALALDGSDMGGLFLKIQPFKSTRANKPSSFSPALLEGYNRIYIGNLFWDITEDDLRKLFSDCTVTSVRFGEDKETGEFKGYAHVDFADSISLNMALKLDQSIVCGRPVRISCAVPKKGTSTKPNFAPNENRMDENKVTAVSAVNKNEELNTDAEPVSSKIRRRTCYECGEKGHLSSSCPTAMKLPSMPKENRVDDNKVGAVSAVRKEESSKGEENRTDSELVSSKRRTCYECGEKGHLSSSCPTAMKLPSMAKENHADDYKVIAVSGVSKDESYKEEESRTDAEPLSSKIRRRTCYECGEKGHLSSSCPTAMKLPTMPKENHVNDNKVGVVSAVRKDESYKEEESRTDANPVSSKIRRRTCYECGEKGHLSSSCPKKQAADTANPSAE